MFYVIRAAVEENAYNRMKKVVKWYISGFYKKPKVKTDSLAAIRRLKSVILLILFSSFRHWQGLKKPYNPIIGETFRCLWIHTKTNSKTFYIAEQVKQWHPLRYQLVYYWTTHQDDTYVVLQVSHHPPVSAFYVSNRKDGFCLSGSILAKSKFYGETEETHY